MKHSGSFFYLLFFIFNFIHHLDAQNLVPNYSFEQIDSCPAGVSEFNIAEPWFLPTQGTTDIYSHCVGSGNHIVVDVPYNWAGYQPAKSGISYAGFYFWCCWGTDSSYREYLEVGLTSELQVNVKYYVSFFLSLADSSAFATDRIGAYFSNDSLLQSNWWNLSEVPQIENSQGSFINDTSKWIQVKGSFIASGGEKYITIGNFHDIPNTDTIGSGTYLYWPSHYSMGYYFIDDVCVSSDSSECLVTGIPDLSNNLDYFSPNPATTAITLHLPISKTSDIIVFNILGEEVMSEHVSSPSSSIALNISSLAQGPYYVVVRNEKKVFGSKFMKQ